MNLIRQPVLLGLLLLVIGVSGGLADELPAEKGSTHQALRPLEDLLNETLSYNLSFLWFDSVAEGSLVLEPQSDEPGRFEAILEARTLGVAAWLTNNRIQRYVSTMERLEDGSLRSLVFESRIIKGEGKEISDRGNRYIFDHETHQVTHHKIRQGVVGEPRLFPMESNEVPSDFLTAFFNFQGGYYGSFIPGSLFSFPTFSRKGPAQIDVAILPLNKRRGDLDFFPEGGVLAKVKVDQELFDTGGGFAYVWFDESGRPVKGMVESVIGIGDVRGTLK